MITADRYWRSVFGQKVYRLSVDGGTTCPNRDGTCGVGGCIFCAEGSGGFAAHGEDIDDQLDRAKSRISAKLKSGLYIAYFQSYTSTYGDVDGLIGRMQRAARRDDIVALSVGTRPDCLPDETVERLAEINAIKPVYVELGLQTADDTTATLINRGYATSVYTDACRRLKEAGLKIITHMIIGLPGQSHEDVINTARLINSTADGIKIQLMHVLRGTALYDMYIRGEYRPLGTEEYLDLLCDALSQLDDSTPVHRMTGDGDKRLLVAPMWSADKKKFLNAVNRRLKERGLI